MTNPGKEDFEVSLGGAHAFSKELNLKDYNHKTKGETEDSFIRVTSSEL